MKSWAVGLSALLACACASASFGETVGLSLLSSPNPGLSGALSVTAKSSGSTQVINSQGAFKWTVTSDTGSTFNSNVVNNIPLYTFCIQAFQTTGTSYMVANLGNGQPLGGTDAGVIDALAAKQIQGLVDKYWSAIDFSKTNGTSYTFNSVAYTDDQVAAAFQIAVWEIEYDGGTGGENFVNGGNTNFFSNTSANLYASVTAGSTNGTKALALANGWLNNFTAANSVSSFALTSSSKQDQLVGVKTPGGGASSPTPLPAAFPGGVALLAGLGIYRKIRSRKA